MNFSNLISVISIREKNQDEIKVKEGDDFKNDDYFPIQIIDIKKSEKYGFKFNIAYIGIKSRQKINKWKKSLNKIGGETKLQILHKFKNHLLLMTEVNSLSSFAHERLALLFDYCHSEKIELNLKEGYQSKFEGEKDIDSKKLFKLRSTVRGGKKIKKRKQKLFLISNNFSIKIEFLRNFFLREIKQIQIGLKELNFVSKSRFFYFLDHLTIHVPISYQKKFIFEE